VTTRPPATSGNRPSLPWTKSVIRTRTRYVPGSPNCAVDGFTTRCWGIAGAAVDLTRIRPVSPTAAPVQRPAAHDPARQPRRAHITITLTDTTPPTTARIVAAAQSTDRRDTIATTVEDRVITPSTISSDHVCCPGSRPPGSLDQG
jgi:hypothetical protein